MCAVIDAGGQDVDDECILLWWAQAQLRGAAEEEGADVHRCACSVRGYILCIEAYSQMHTSPKHLHRHFRDRDKRGRMLHSLSVLLGAKDVDGLVGGVAEGFEAFVALLAVVEGGGHAVEAEEGGGDEGGGGPLVRFLGEVAFNVAVDFADAEADVVPV